MASVNAPQVVESRTVRVSVPDPDRNKKCNCKASKLFPHRRNKCASRPRNTKEVVASVVGGASCMVAAGALLYLQATEEEVRHTTTTTTTTTTETLVHNFHNNVTSTDAQGQPLIQNVHVSEPSDSVVVGQSAGSDTSAATEGNTSTTASAAELSTVTTTVEQTTTSVRSGTSTATLRAIVGSTASQARAAELLSGVLPSSAPAPAPAPAPAVPPVPPPSDAFLAAAAASASATASSTSASTSFNSSQSVSGSTTSSARIAASAAPIWADLEASSAPVAEMERMSRGNSSVQQESEAIPNIDNFCSRLIQMDQQFQVVATSSAGTWIERQRRLLQLRYHQKAYLDQQFQLQSSMAATVSQQDEDGSTAGGGGYASTELAMPQFDFETASQVSSLSNFDAATPEYGEEVQVDSGSAPAILHYLECMNLFLGHIISQVTYNNDLYSLCNTLLGPSGGAAIHNVEEVQRFKNMLIERGRRYAIVQLSSFVPPAVAGMHQLVAYFAPKNDEDATIISKFVDTMWTKIDATGEVAVLHSDAHALLEEIGNIAQNISVA